MFEPVRAAPATLPRPPRAFNIDGPSPPLFIMASGVNVAGIRLFLENRRRHHDPQGEGACGIHPGSAAGRAGARNVLFLLVAKCLDRSSDRKQYGNGLQEWHRSCDETHDCAACAAACPNFSAHVCVYVRTADARNCTPPIVTVHVSVQLE